MTKTRITVVRINDNGQNTLSKIFIDDNFECFGLEDTFRPKKVYGQTRIPKGLYDLTLRTVGGKHSQYTNHRNATIRSIHKGMLWVRNVPGFEYILIHIGNYARDTHGCLLVGKDWVYNQQRRERMITNSTDAYINFYNKVYEDTSNGNVEIMFLDADRND
jgi:hypothetical protein